MIGLYALIIVSVYWGIQSLINNIVKDVGENLPVPVSSVSLYSFPNIWHNLTYISGALKLILAIIVVIFITNEYTYRTLRQNIITGMSRQEFLLSKVLLVVFLAVIATLFIYINALILGFINTVK